MYFAENPKVAEEYRKQLSNFDEPFIKYGKKKLTGSEMTDVDLETLKYLEIGRSDAGQFPHNTVYYAKQAAKNNPEVLQKLDEFGRKSIKLQAGDIIIEWNGIEVNDKNIPLVMESYTKSVRESDPLIVKVQRRINGKLEEINLETKITPILVLKKDVFSFVSNPTEEQLNLRKAWLGTSEQN
jgi:hypothetical protein